MKHYNKNMVIYKHVCKDFSYMLESPKLEKPLLHIWHNHSSQVELNCHVLG